MSAASGGPRPNDRRQIFAWAMYDWANSAYVTTVVVAVLPAYFARGIVPADGFLIAGHRYSAPALWGALVSLAALIVFLTAPVLGAVADLSGSKKRFLLAGAYGGSVATGLLAFCGPGDVWPTMLLFLVAQVAFVGANVFYDAFLPHVASEGRLDRVSGQGFACGYLGGGLHFALSLALIAGHTRLGISEGAAARIAIGSAGLWWAAFSVIPLVMLREGREAEAPGTAWRRYVAMGFGRTLRTAARLRRVPHLLLFLVAYMVYNDGIETVIVMATIYGKDELGFSTAHLMLTLLVIQAIALVGALAFGRLAEWLSPKTALMVTLALWSGVVLYAYRMTSPGEYLALGLVVGVVLGGSQALSRSLYGAMIPPEASAEFYGFYSVFNKFSAIWGPLVFAVIRETTGSSRGAILSIIVFFVVGLVLLSQVDVERAKQARTALI